jgi:DNA polymerase-4
MPVTELCASPKASADSWPNTGMDLRGHEALPISVLARRFGNPGRRIWYMCQGADPEKLQREVPAPKSIGHGKVVPPDTRDREVLLTYLLHMSEKVGARLRRHRLRAMIFFIGLRTAGGWVGGKQRCALPTDDGRRIMALCRVVMEESAGWGTPGR